LGLSQARTIRGFCHLYDGQEAVAMGVESALEKSDSWITSYRCLPIFHGFSSGINLLARTDATAQPCAGGVHQKWCSQNCSVTWKAQRRGKEAQCTSTGVLAFANDV
jgi:TPP-dependent pyruvate/acetoin dehydrogenase alpha subunit